MSLQGPILLVAETPDGELVQALSQAGAGPIASATFADAAAAFADNKPSAIVVGEPDVAHVSAAQALVTRAARSLPLVPAIARVTPDRPSALADALPIDQDVPAERLIARLDNALRLRALHASVIGRARTLKAERNIVADLPAGDLLDDATVLLVGRGRHHATLSVAVGERMGVMGALSVDAAARCLAAREVDGVIVGDGLPIGSVENLLAVMAEDSRFRELPVAWLGGGHGTQALTNLVRARDPLLLLERAAPLVRMRAFESALKRLLASIDSKGMLDPRTGLLNAQSFGLALARAIEDAGERCVGLSLACFAFADEIDRRTSMDAARLVSRLTRDADFACRQADGSILFAFADTDLRAAHVAARRLAAVLKHTMLRRDRERPGLSPSVTLATLKPTDDADSLLARVLPRPVAAA